MIWLQILADAIRREVEYQLILRKRGWHDSWDSRRWWVFGPEPWCGAHHPFRPLDWRHELLVLIAYWGPEWKDGILMNRSPYFTKDGKLKTHSQWEHEVTNGKGFVGRVYLGR